MSKFSGKTQFSKSFARFAFPQNFHTRTLGEITVFDAMIILHFRAWKIFICPYCLWFFYCKKLVLPFFCPLFLPISRYRNAVNFRKATLHKNCRSGLQLIKKDTLASTHNFIGTSVPNRQITCMSKYNKWVLACGKIAVHGRCAVFIVNFEQVILLGTLMLWCANSFWLTSLWCFNRWLWTCFELIQEKVVF